MVTIQILDLHSDYSNKENSKYKRIVERDIEFRLHLCPYRILHKNTPTVETRPHKLRVGVYRSFDASLWCT
jgi:hypothetical protein